MKIIKSIFVLIVVSLLSLSCEDWLDVKPQTQVEASDLLASEAGYKDALWGVYTLMTQSSMYGLHMTASLDAMAKLYTTIGTSSVEYDLSKYNYTTTKATNLTVGVWQKSYAAIANLNNLIAHIREADPGMFSEDNYNVIYGEALGLRAFLHFDLLRLFAPSYADAPDAKAIPYVTTFDYNITPSSSVSETVELILKDLETASTLLKQADPLCTGREITGKDDNGYLLDRKLRFNYYAVTATMARVYLWKGDQPNAARKAQEVIDDSGVKWTTVDNMAVDEEMRDMTFTSEQIFALEIEDMSDNILYTFSTTYAWAKGNTMALSAPAAAFIFPYSTDWRGYGTVYLWSKDLSINNYYVMRTPTKLWQYEDMPADYKNRMPLIRLPEMKLIVAECDPVGQGVEIINEIRTRRGITTEFTAATEEKILNEIANEYRREFYAEGVMWYYYKRLNKSSIPYYEYYGYNTNYQSMNRKCYVWPMPDEELEFGNRNNNQNEK